MDPITVSGVVAWIKNEPVVVILGFIQSALTIVVTQIPGLSTGQVGATIAVVTSLLALITRELVSPTSGKSGQSGPPPNDPGPSAQAVNTEIRVVSSVSPDEIAKSVAKDVRRLSRSLPAPGALLLASILAIFGCFGLAASTSGCAGLLAATPALLNDVSIGLSDASVVLELISSAEKSYFAAQSAPDAAKQAKIEHDIDVCRLALLAGEHATSGARALSADQVDAAFAQFREAYTVLEQDLKSIGIGPRLAYGQAQYAGGRLAFPTPKLAKPLKR